MRLPSLSRQRCVLGAALLGAAALAAAGCRQFEYVSMRALEDAGFRYSSIQQLQHLDVTKAEVAELAKAANGGVDQATCILLAHVARGQKTHFAEGDAAASLHAAGVADETIVGLAQLRQLATWSGEAAAIRLTGTSDRVILAVARRRSMGQPVPAGATLARLKDAGVSEATLLELISLGLTDSTAATVEYQKKHRWTDEQVLRDFPPKS